MGTGTLYDLKLTEGVNILSIVTKYKLCGRGHYYIQERAQLINVISTSSVPVPKARYISSMINIGTFHMTKK